MSALFEQLSTIILEGASDKSAPLVQKALDEGLSAKEILENGLLVGMNEVGARFKRGDMFVPEVLMSAEAMHEALDVLRPHLVSGGVKLQGKIVLGTVKGDLHDIGKNLVGMMCEGAGFEVINLGFNVEPEKFVVKFTPVNPTIAAEDNGIVNALPDEKGGAVIRLKESLGRYGFESIISFGEYEENRIGSNCGQYIRRFMGNGSKLKEAYSYSII